LVTASYWSLSEGTATPAVLLWLAGQSIFTMAANMKEMRPGGVASGQDASWLWGTLGVAAAGVALLVIRDQWATALNVYLGLLALYGIAFPALIMAWCRRRSPRPTPGGLTALTLLLLVAGWLGNIGFITGPSWVAVLPAAIILLTPGLIGKR